MNIELKEIKEWSGDKSLRRGEVRLYCGKILIGKARPCNRYSDQFYFFSSNHEMIESLVENEMHTLEDIKIHIECSLKEFIKKILK